MYRKHIAAAILALSVPLTTPLAAQENTSPAVTMTSEEIREAAVGNTTFGTFADRPLSYAVYVAPDGRLIGKLMDGTAERIETGTWSIENDRLIGQWDSLKGGEANAFAYVLFGTNVHAIRDDGTLDRVQFFVDGDPLGLDTEDPAADVKTAVTRWIDLWNAGENPIDAARFARYADVFAEGDGYLAVDDFTGEVLTLRSYATYAATWGPVMASFDSWTISLVGDIDVDLSGDTAIAYFEFAGNGRLRDGTPIEGYSHSTLVLRKTDGQWRIVHEHLTNAEPPRAANAVSPEDEVKAFVSDWSSAWSPGDGAEGWSYDQNVAALYADDVLAFDLTEGRTVIRGKKGHRSIWEPFVRSFDRWRFTALPESIEIVVSGASAFVTVFVDNEGYDTEGKRLFFPAQATLFLERNAGSWRIVHEHISFPRRE